MFKTLSAGYIDMISNKYLLNDTTMEHTSYYFNYMHQNSQLPIMNFISLGK